MDKVTVDAKALREILVALNGPGHLIRELIAIRNIQGNDNPINRLVSDYNLAVDEFNKSQTNTETEEEKKN